jgi:hypothetical protein
LLEFVSLLNLMHRGLTSVFSGASFPEFWLVADIDDDEVHAFVVDASRVRASAAPVHTHLTLTGDRSEMRGAVQLCVTRQLACDAFVLRVSRPAQD